MNYRTYSLIVVWWIFIDMMIKSYWFSENFHPDSECIRLIRIVVPLLLSVGVGYYGMRKWRNKTAVVEPWWRIVTLLCIFLLMSVIIFFRWY